jgi:hypothetical protein
MQLSRINLSIATTCGIAIMRIRHLDVTHMTGKKSVRRESRTLRCFIRKPHDNSGANIKRSRRCLRVLKIVLSRGCRPSYLLGHSPIKAGAPYQSRTSLRQASISKTFDIERELESERTPSRVFIFYFLSCSLQSLTDSTLYKM